MLLHETSGWEIEHITCSQQSNIFRKFHRNFNDLRVHAIEYFRRRQIPAEAYTAKLPVRCPLLYREVPPASRVHSIADFVPGNSGKVAARSAGFADRSIRLKLGGSSFKEICSSVSESSIIISSKSSRPSQTLLPLHKKQHEKPCWIS